MCSSWNSIQLEKDDSNRLLFCSFFKFKNKFTLSEKVLYNNVYKLLSLKRFQDMHYLSLRQFIFLNLSDKNEIYLLPRKVVMKITKFGLK